MDQEQPHGALADAGEIVELCGGRVWELTTASDERVIIDRGFRPNGGSTRSRWRHHDGPWWRLFSVRPVESGITDGTPDGNGPRVVIGWPVEVWTGFRDVWRTETPLVAVRELVGPEA